MKLLICTPCYGGLVTTQYLLRMIDTYEALRSDDRVKQIAIYTLETESLIPRGRNKCARFALMNDYDKLLFIDADMVWTPEDVKLLLDSKKPIIGGTYPLKTFPITLNFNALAEKGAELWNNTRLIDDYMAFKAKFADAKGEVEVRHIPTGFMLIDTKVFKKLIQDGTAPRYQTFQPDNNTVEVFYDFFPIGVVEGEYESEDWAFCSLASKAGFPIHLQTKVVTGHIGVHHYQLGQHVLVGQKPLL